MSKLPSPALQNRDDIIPFLLIIGSAIASIAALLLDVYNVIRMPYTISFASLPGFIFLIMIPFLWKDGKHNLLAHRVSIGLISGIAGLIVYNLSRLIAQWILPVKFDAFFAMPVFGELMTGKPRDSAFAIVAGWLYHITNGLTFSVIYAVVAGSARWWWGLVWGGGLEFAMMVVYPSIFNISDVNGFVIISVIGHTAFGAAVGLICENLCILAKESVES